MLTLLSFACSNDDSSSSNQTISLKINGENVTATVTQAFMYKSQSIDRQTLFIEAENDNYKFNLKLIDEYNSNDNSFSNGDYDFANIYSSLDYSEFFIYYKVSGQTNLYHYPDSSLYNVNFCDGVANKISATFSAYLTSVDGEDITVDGVLVPYIIEITEGQFNNIEYTVTEIE
ncbi:hypothetical protein [Flavobacterium sp. U410]